MLPLPLYSSLLLLLINQVLTGSHCQDGENPCPDGSCVKAIYRCPDHGCEPQAPNACFDKQKCFEDIQRCNEGWDCADGSDELDCLPTMPLFAGFIYYLRQRCFFHELAEEVGPVFSSGPHGSLQITNRFSELNNHSTSNNHITALTINHLGGSLMNGRLSNSLLIDQASSSELKHLVVSRSGSSCSALPIFKAQAHLDHMASAPVITDESQECLLTGIQESDVRLCHSLPHYPKSDSDMTGSLGPIVPTAPPEHDLHGQMSPPPPTYEEAMHERRDSSLPPYDTVSHVVPDSDDEEGNTKKSSDNIDADHALGNHLHFLPSRQRKKRRSKALQLALGGGYGSDTDSWTSTSSSDY